MRFYVKLCVRKVLKETFGNTSQYFLHIQSVGVMGDYRTYDHTGIRAVTSIDGMTSDFARIDWEVLQKSQAVS